MAIRLLQPETGAASMQMSAQFDSSGRYRFSLHRLWRETGEIATIIMLNPSTADHLRNDPTIARCIQLARFWGFAGINVVNLFAYRTSSPAHLRQIRRPVGKDNDSHIRKNAESSGTIILGWGNHGAWRSRDREVVELLQGHELLCIGTTKSGQPRHPLYAPGTIKLRKFIP